MNAAVPHDQRVEAVWKFEGLEWSRRSNRYVTRRYWNVRVAGKVFEGFGSRREATEYGQRMLELLKVEAA